MTDYGYAEAPQAPGRHRSSNIFNWLGAAASLALVLGISVWGYRVLSRDVSGVPVVARLSGEIRRAPDADAATGVLAPNQGLAVNEVMGEGVAGATPDRLATAPADIGLSAEDGTPAQLAAPTAVPAPPSDSPLAFVNGSGVSDPDLAGSVQNGGDGPQVANAIPEADALPDTIPSAETTGTNGIPLRPKARPSTLSAARLTLQRPGTDVSPRTPTREIEIAALASGTRLVQVGALDSVAAARSEWDRLATKFPDYFEGKARVIERAEHSGKVFYRLRAHGFADLAESRRFCVVLEHYNEGCITAAVP